jgi:hypothetical protein
VPVDLCGTRDEPLGHKGWSGFDRSLGPLLFDGGVGEQEMVRRSQYWAWKQTNRESLAVKGWLFIFSSLAIIAFVIARSDWF